MAMFDRLKILSLIFLFVIVCEIHSQSTTIQINNNDYADDDQSTTLSSILSSDFDSNRFIWSKSINNAFDLAFFNDTFMKMINVDRKNSTLSNNFDNELDDDCQIDQIIDDIFPSDYQVDRHFDFQKAVWTENIDETFNIAHRLIDLGRNFSRRFSPLLQRMSRQFSFLAYELQLSPQCMASLVKIGQAMNKNELWSFKCTIYSTFTFCF